MAGLPVEILSFDELKRYTNVQYNDFCGHSSTYGGGGPSMTSFYYANNKHTQIKRPVISKSMHVAQGALNNDVIYIACDSHPIMNSMSHITIRKSTWDEHKLIHFTVYCNDGVGDIDGSCYYTINTETMELTEVIMNRTNPGTEFSIYKNLEGHMGVNSTKQNICNDVYLNKNITPLPFGDIRLDLYHGETKFSGNTTVKDALSMLTNALKFLLDDAKKYIQDRIEARAEQQRLRDKLLSDQAKRVEARRVEEARVESTREEEKRLREQLLLDQARREEEHKKQLKRKHDDKYGPGDLAGGYINKKYTLKK